MSRVLCLCFLIPAALLAQVPASSQLDAELKGNFTTVAARPATAHRGPLMRDLEPLMVQQARYLISELQPWSVDPRAARLPLVRGAASGEHGIRPSAHTAKGLALLVRLAPDEVFPDTFPRSLARDRALALLRYLVRTHGASGATCPDGKRWKGQWQSAYWAGMAGEAAWLLWEDLTPAERWLAARMVCDEADRFVGVTPPANLSDDSKAEENAWNSTVVSLAFSMFPQHPRHAAWRETAIRWIASSFPTARDATRTEVVDDRPLKDWVAGANLFEDFTLENHRRVHPDYMACTYLLTSQVPMYSWGGYQPPAAIGLNVRAINAVLQQLATPEGSVIYPNGQDWGLHRNIDWLEYHAALAVLYGDARSAALLRHSLATVRRMAARSSGSVYLRDETKLPSDQAMVLEYAAHTYALMAERGEGPAPTPDAQLWTELAGTRVFDQGKFGVHRTADSIATFSWGAQVMGLVVPLREDLLLSPEARGLVGHVVFDGLAAETPVVKQVVVDPLSAGFGVTGILTRGGGAIEQRFGFLALPDGRVLYVDVLTATGSARPTRLDLGTLGVLNDLNWPLHRGSRTVTHQNGSQVFTAAAATRDSIAEWNSPWFHLDGLGIVRLDASGPARYVPAPTNAAGRLEQRFHLNTALPTTLASAKPGAPLAHGALLFLPNCTAAQTRDAAARCALLSPPGDLHVSVRLDDGTAVSFDLKNLRLSLAQPLP